MKRRRRSVKVSLAGGAEALAVATPESFPDLLSAELTKATDRSARQLAWNVLRNPKNAARGERRSRRRFEKRLARAWHPALEIFDVFQALATEFGGDVNEYYRKQRPADDDYLFEAIIRLHGRGCMTASEIGALLRSGHATGANARWRTLGELAITAYFLRQHGQNTARRYLEHEAIIAYRAALEYQAVATSLGDEPYSEREIEEMRSTRDQLLRQYGTPYGTDYGWAADALKSNRPTFAAITASVDMSHWKPYIRMASHGIHSGPRGSYWDLGLPTDLEMAIPAGPSHFGLADPGMNTMISLGQLSTLLLEYVLWFDTEDDEAFEPAVARHAQFMTTMKALLAVQDVGCRVFAEIQAHRASVPAELGRRRRLIEYAAM